jgi:hypothetical protein
MFHSSPRPSMARPRFATRILIKLSAQGLAILGSVLVALLIMPVLAGAQTAVFTCGTDGTAWNNTTGACGGAPGIPGSTGYPFAFFGSAGGGQGISSGVLTIQAAGITHTPGNVNRTSGAVNVTAFQSHIRWVPDSWNLAFILNNATHNTNSGPAPGFTIASSFTAGAGCEGAFYQAFGGGPPPNNIFALNFDSGNLLVNSLTPFYSNVQIYQQLQDPCIPADGTEPYYQGHQNKVSTSPVPMNSPATTYQTTIGHTFDGTIIYTGTTVTVNLFDVTGGGTCSPVTSGTCFTYSWPNVSIPSLVDGTTAWLGLGGTSNGATNPALTVPAWSYYTLTAASTPTFSPAAGAYGSAQTVTISDSSSGSTICYNTTGAPYTDGNGNCPNGTKYTGTISVAKGQTLYAVAGIGSSTYGDSSVGSASYNITGSASTPVFNQPGGTWQGNQTVQLTAAQGGVICYNTTGSPATNGSTGCTTGTLYSTPIAVSANETLYAVAGGTGFTDSPIGSAAYVISPFAVVDGYTGVYPSNGPTFSPVPGTYSSAQSVTLSTTTSGANICYVLSATTPTLLPEPDSLGGCAVGTLYSSPITVSSSQSLYAAAGTTTGAYGTAGTGPPSSVVQGAYTISPSGGSSTRPAPPSLNAAQVN